MLSNGINLKGDHLAEITDDEAVNVVIEKFEEVRDENKHLKRQMEFLEAQLQGRHNGI